MYLRSGKWKPDYIDLDDFELPVVRKYNTRSSKIKNEPVESTESHQNDAHQFQHRNSLCKVMIEPLELSDIESESSVEIELPESDAEPERHTIPHIVETPKAPKPKLKRPNSVDRVPFHANKQAKRLLTFRESEQNNYDLPVAKTPTLPPPNIYRDDNENDASHERDMNRRNERIFIRKEEDELWKKESTEVTANYIDILQLPNRFPAMQQLPVRIIQKSTASVKNSDIAFEYSNIADIAFLQSNWSQALEYYNRSICYALGGFHMSTAYAKRGQCWFKMAKYKNAWFDLLLAESIGLPPQFVGQFEKLKRILYTSKMYETAEIKPSLSFAPDPLYPEMANAIRINYNKTYGRHLIARRQINVGQIVLCEIGFVSTTTQYYKMCCICLSTDKNLMPAKCGSECTKAMICQRCSGRKFHEIECKLQSKFDADDHQWVTKVVRSILSAVALFKSADELMNFVEASISTAKLQGPAPITDLKSKYRAFLQLANKPQFNANLAPIATKLVAALIDHKVTGRVFGLTKHRRFLTHLILHHIEVIRKFATKTIESDGIGFIETVAPIAALLNHSCAPNAAKFLLNNSIVVVAMRPIAAGEQLFVSYCDLMKNRDERGSILQTKHGFKCTCERCQLPCGVTYANPELDQNDCIIAYLAEAFVQQYFYQLASDDQSARKEISGRITDVLQHFGRLPWHYTTNWAYICFSLLLSRRFQNKLQY